MNEPSLRMWTVYERPSDFADVFVARLWLIQAATFSATDRVVFGRSLEEVRAAIPDRGLTMITRQPGDDPTIVEVWF